MNKRRAVTAEVKINMAPEGGWINWSEEVEEADPPGWYPRHEAEQKKPPRVRKEVKKEVRIRKETTCPYYMPLGIYLAMKEGKEGGARIEKQMEEKYMAQIMREPGICKSPQWPKFTAFQVEKLEEGALQKLIRGWEGGLEIVDVGKGGKTQLCVVMHAMSPNSCHIVTPVTSKEEASQDTGSDQMKGVEKEVNNC